MGWAISLRRNCRLFVRTYIYIYIYKLSIVLKIFYRLDKILTKRLAIAKGPRACLPLVIKLIQFIAVCSRSSFFFTFPNCPGAMQERTIKLSYDTDCFCPERTANRMVGPPDPRAGPYIGLPGLAFSGPKNDKFGLFYIGWPGRFLEFIKYLAFFKVYIRFYFKIKTFFLF